MPRHTFIVTILDPLGFHARPCTQVSEVAGRFSSSITVTRTDKTDKSANAKSVMELLMLLANCGTQLSVTAEGEDAEVACDALVKLFETEINISP